MRQNSIIFAADAYTISSNKFVSVKARQKSVYNLTNRYSPRNVLPELCRDSRMVMFGLSWYINKFMTRQVTHNDVYEAKDFMAHAHSFGGAMSFDVDMWNRVVEEHNGYLPIKIEGIEEGSTFFPNQPYVQVTAQDGFGELAAHVEALLVGYVSIASARVTLCRHWMERIHEWLRQEGVAEEKLLDYSRWMIHDFGMRGSSCEEESELLGLAHLLVFNGTDTFNAAFLAKKMGAPAGVGTSIHALAHRIVQGHPSESDAFLAINAESGRVCPANIASYVADCYNYSEALDYLAEQARDNPNNIYVVRPDSGDYVQTVLDVCKRNLPNLRFIQGDGMNPQKIKAVVEAIHAAGFKLHEKGIFGVGGWLRNTPTRDLFSSAYKLAAIGDDNEPVCKLSEVKTKMSVPGPTKLKPTKNILPSGESVYFEDEFNLVHDKDRYLTYYNQGKTTPYIPNSVRNPNFSKLRDTVYNSFNEAGECMLGYEYGLDDSLFSNSVAKFRNDTFNKHRG